VAVLLEDEIVAILRPSTFTVTVTVTQISDGTNSSLEITVDSDGRDAILEWLKENNASDGFLVISDVDGDVFSYRADTVTNLEILRDMP
jgi:hypothetical protein